MNGQLQKHVVTTVGLVRTTTREWIEVPKSATELVPVTHLSADGLRSIDYIEHGALAAYCSNTEKNNLGTK